MTTLTEHGVSIEPPVALQQEHSYLQPRAGLRNASIVDDEPLDYLESPGAGGRAPELGVLPSQVAALDAA